MAAADLAVAALAADQHGVFTRHQALALGMSEGGISWRVKSGRWRRLRPRVFAIAGSSNTWHQRLMAACLGSGGLASHRAAAHLWNLPGFGAGRIEIVVDRTQQVRPRGELVHRSVDLWHIQPVARAAMPTTPIDRTVLDLGAVVHPDRYPAVVHRCVGEGRVSWRQLLDAVLLHGPRRGRDGLGRLRSVVDADLGSRPSESDLEQLLERVIVQAGLPRPARQVVVHDRAGRFVARVDLAYPAQRIAIEADGRAHHSDPADFERDRVRQNRLVLAGWTVLRFTWRDVLERSHAIEAEVRAALVRQ